ncbi:hypothetical protein HG536_0E03080 [Torulaspora globosa]|uniref:CRIB domain-containing protein n=1 Tax=Torulaspora globosa TaxID=48254 RepID=A0A7G3ZIR1_9SACH|nr:uncharacterized protein HG536_0E03080 [Torulaspora globosa]QLL33397.1 hypothetical protein HG536_0E03080 [Torulaspora globosa]
MATAGTFNLPQMKSIWLDEDEEAEKLYGLQVQQFMGPDDEDDLAITMVNSDKPLLSNKKNIDLAALGKNIKTSKFLSTSALTPSRKKASIKKKGFFALFKNKEHHVLKDTAKISSPFAFQHISHADVRTGFEEERQEEQSAQAENQPKSRPLSRAFVTHSTTDSSSGSGEVNERKRASARMSVSTTGSSRYSRFSTTGRIASSSTMATSILHESSSPHRAALISGMDKLTLRERKNRESSDSGSSISFLRDYDFPALIEVQSATECPKTPTKRDTMGDSKRLASSPNRLKRAKSSSQLLRTPEIENRWFNEETPASRKSLDDVLLCYHQPSNSATPSQITPVKSSA